MIVIATFACAPAVATAADRYASPTGSGSECTQANPCSLQTAAGSQAASGDLVHAAGGVYEVGSLILHEVTVAGPQSGAPATIRSQTDRVALFGASGARIRDLTIEHTQPPSTLNTGIALALTNDAKARRVVVSSVDGSACQLQMTSELADSVCLYERVASPHNRAALSVFGTDLAGSADVRVVNVTTDGSMGVVASGSATATMTISNSIAKSLFTAGSGSIVADHSNFQGASGNVTTGSQGGNQSAPPVFVDAANNDLRQMPTSPTIDAGSDTAAGVGTTDFEGDPRPQGSAIDIGADEIDNVAPDTSIDSGPGEGDVTGSPRPRFEFSSSEPNSQFRCRVDDEEAFDCASPLSLAELPHGEHLFEVWAIDPAGNADADPAQVRFLVDRLVDGPGLTGKAVQKQRGKPVVKVNVAVGEPADVELRGEIWIGSTRVGLKKRDLLAGPGPPAPVVLKPVRKSDGEKVLAALKAGRKVSSTVRASFEDEFGNSDRKKLRVKLR